MAKGAAGCQKWLDLDFDTVYWIEPGDGNLTRIKEGIATYLLNPDAVNGKILELGGGKVVSALNKDLGSCIA